MADGTAATKKSRKSNFSPEEIAVLVASVRAYHKTLYGRFAKRATNRGTRHKAWLDILRKVNGVSVEKRTLQEVKNKWKKCQYGLKDRAFGDGRPEPEDVPGPSTAASRGERPQSDSMPLQERLVKPDKISMLGNTGTHPQMHKSQPLSPTKLKVTRHHQPPQRLPPRAETASSPPANEEMCLRWNSHHSNMQKAFPSILSKEQFVDVTLASEGKVLKCHRLILSSCSPYFEEILSGISPAQHPVLFMRDIPFWILKSLCDFMYAGEVHVYQNKLEELLQVAEALKIKGLAGKSSQSERNQAPQNSQRAVETVTNYRTSSSRDDRRALEIRPQFESNPSIRQNVRVLESSGHDYESEQLLDPLDLLEPVYEEEDRKPSFVQKAKNVSQQQQQQQMMMKKVVPKKIKKRKFSDPPPRIPSPPPVFHLRKGTRSRPNVKIPKYYDTDFVTKPTSTMTHHQDSLIELDEIKTEPIDVEDNLIDYGEDPFAPVDPKFKKIRLSQPIITNVTTCDEMAETPMIAGLEVIKIPAIQNGDDDNNDDDDDDDKGPDPPNEDAVSEDEDRMRAVTSLDHLEKEAMSIANAIVLETGDPPDGRIIDNI